MNEFLLEARNVGKAFAGIQALKDVTFGVRAGEIHALCGENGAGKSTLMRILDGSLQPDSGGIYLSGIHKTFSKPLKARRAGVLLIHQEISLVPELSVAENVFLGQLPTRWGQIDGRTLLRATTKLLQECDLDVNPSALVSTLSIAQQQRVEILRAFAFPYSVVIFDEPTASLSEAESQRFFSHVERLRQRDIAVVYISHRIREIFRLADRISVLRDGEISSTFNTRSTNEAEVTQAMVGRSVVHTKNEARNVEGKEVLHLESFSWRPGKGGISLSLHKGEILGLYGLVGAGRSELAETLFGLRAVIQGTLYWKGQSVSIRCARQAVELGMGFVPEDRKTLGLMMELGILENLSLVVLPVLCRSGFILKRREKDLFDKLCRQLGIRTVGAHRPVSILSGGNQQKILLAKWLARRPELLILDEPTRGIDVGAKAEVHALIRSLSAEGIAILMISSEMPEVMSLSDRIVTMRDGSITGKFASHMVTEELLLKHSAPILN